MVLKRNGYLTYEKTRIWTQTSHSSQLIQNETDKNIKCKIIKLLEYNP